MAGAVVTVDRNQVDAELRLLSDRLHVLARETGKEFGFIVRSNGRLIAISLAVQTQPFSGGEGNFGDNSNYSGGTDRKKGEQAILRDVNRVYRTIDQMYKQIKLQTKSQQGGGDRAARAFYGAAINGNFERANRILESFRIFDRGVKLGRFDGGAAHKAARNKRGSVSSKRARLVVIDPKRLVTYVKKIQRNVGFAKGAWASAAQTLGGTRGLPQWVTRHKNAAYGHATDNTRQINNPHVVLHNNVPWINQVISPRGITQALRYRRGRMETQIRNVVAYNARKAGFRA